MIELPFPGVITTTCPSSKWGRRTSKAYSCPNDYITMLITLTLFMAFLISVVTRPVTFAVFGQFPQTNGSCLGIGGIPSISIMLPLFNIGSMFCTNSGNSKRFTSWPCSERSAAIAVTPLPHPMIATFILIKLSAMKSVYNIFIQEMITDAAAWLGEDVVESWKKPPLGFFTNQYFDYAFPFMVRCLLYKTGTNQVKDPMAWDLF